MSADRPPVDEVTATRDRRLADYALELGQAVELDLLVAAGGGPGAGPRLVTGDVTGATDGVLLLASGPTRRTVRVPWAAIATIRNAVPTHPANS
jgi:hypothetical protein